MKATYVDGIMFLNSEQYKARVYLPHDRAVAALGSHGYTCYTISNRRGYIKRAKGKDSVYCLAMPYKGRYGEGFTLHLPDKRTAYHTVEYYVK